MRLQVYYVSFNRVLRSLTVSEKSEFWIRDNVSLPGFFYARQYPDYAAKTTIFVWFSFVPKKPILRSKNKKHYFAPQPNEQSSNYNNKAFY